jgi:hypothetical protein
MVEKRHSEGDDGFVVFQADFTNAFNCVGRDAVLRGAMDHAPASYNWLKWCYTGASPLYCQGGELCKSKAGVHQGDAMGPLGFVLGLKTVLDRCTSRTGLDWEVWYLDDGHVVGSLEAVTRFVHELRSGAQGIGLELNLGKCLLWGPGARKEGEARGKAWESIPRGHPAWLVPNPPYGPGCGGLTALGVPVDHPGSTVTRDQKWGVAVGRTVACLDKLRGHPEGQVRQALLRSSLNACRVTNLLRAVDGAAAGDWPRKLRASLRQGVTDLVGIGLTDAQHVQASLPISLGGLGVDDPVRMQPGARMAALVDFHLHAVRRVGVGTDVVAFPASDFGLTCRKLATGLGPAAEPVASWLGGVSEISSATKEQATQRWWARQISVRCSDELMATGSLRDRARRGCQRGPLAGGWLQACPSRDAGTEVPDGEWRLLLKWRLGVAILPERRAPPACPLCGMPVDQWGDHLVSCTQNGPTGRHHALRDGVFETCLRYGIGAIREVPSEPSRRPADVLLTRWARGRDVAVDFVVGHPLVLSEQPIEVGSAVGRVNGLEAKKVSENSATCAQAGWGFLPFGATTWGGIGPSAKHLLGEIVRVAAAGLQGRAADEVAGKVHQDLSTRLMRQIARQLGLAGRVLDEDFGAWEDGGSGAPGERVPNVGSLGGRLQESILLGDILRMHLSSAEGDSAASEGGALTLEAATEAASAPTSAGGRVSPRTGARPQDRARERDADTAVNLMNWSQPHSRLGSGRSPKH